MPINEHQTLLLSLKLILLYLSAYYTVRRRRMLMGVGRGNGVGRTPRRNWETERNVILRRFYMESDNICHTQLRMRRSIFHMLCAQLKRLGLSDSRHVIVEEQVAMFLLTVGHDHRNRNMVMQFFRSGQTMSHYFHIVLNAIIRLYRIVVHNATKENSPVECRYQVGWHDYFKDAVGALDGTHFEAMVPLHDQQRYRNRKGVVSQNVLVACTFNMRFTYVLAGWEGSARDGRVLRSAVSREGHKLTIPTGKYYLADAEFGMTPGFLTPYRGVRYHLNEQGNPPSNEKEMYNFRHSSLQSVVERAIGVLKKRFPYLQHAPFHDVRTQARIILACCALHNWLRNIDPDDEFDPDQIFDDDLEDDEFDPDQIFENEEPINDDLLPTTMMPSTTWNAFRNDLALRMWNSA